jgi:hypothetical protein
MIHCGIALLVFPAKAGIHSGMGTGLRGCNPIPEKIEFGGHRWELFLF